MFVTVERARDINIVGDNRTLLFGRVVDVADNGLHIDLLCPGRRREFVSLNRVSLSERCLNRYWNQTEPLPVEVLRRECPDGPWRWCPAKMINPARIWDASYWCEFWECSTVAVVEGESEGGVTWTDIVPKHRIRDPVPDNWWTEQRPIHFMWSRLTLPLRVGPGRFVKCNMPFPLECRGASVAQLVQVIQDLQTMWRRDSKGQVVWVDVADEQVQYIVEVGDTQDSYGRPEEFPPPQTQDVAQKIVRAMHNALIRGLPGILRAIQAPVKCVNVLGTMDECCVLRLDEWQEVFTHLDTPTQIQLRAVCPAWDAVLDFPDLTANIIIETGGTNPQLLDLQYILTALIFKRLRSSTKNVILHDREQSIHVPEFYTMLDMIHYVAQNRPGIRLTGVYVAGVTNLFSQPRHPVFSTDPQACEVHKPGAGNGFSGHLGDLIAAFRDLPCNAIHLVRCRVRLQYDLTKLLKIWDTSLELDVDLPWTRVPVGGDVASTVWEAVEAALPAPSEAASRALSAWLAAIEAEDNHALHRMAVCKVLCTTQTADPRPSSLLRGKKWCKDGLQDLRWEELSRFSLRFLLLLGRRLSKLLTGPSDSGGSPLNIVLK
ncbi:uncharacterized protein LOC129582761 [Paramacrobiotus metropolitanus]|uniref:uncharacterized protein LOC129582761 n=1 Tax=Paramacrobiotus metropolitanus TaxID=2943436 RepID=UPI002445B77A|nr:uncharacterized protein LOC129582761 [Paramacrobiotus metropolitanus]